jgi:DNA (cytosine-5)-methyltransferase 1
LPRGRLSPVGVLDQAVRDLVLGVAAPHVVVVVLASRYGIAVSADDEGPIRAVELFAGIGGFRLAVEALGVETVWANDHDSDACSVYKRRFGHDALVGGDLRESKADIPPHELLTAGFPCQPFSSAGKKRGVRDPRGTLFAELASIVAEHRPKYFVLENVKRLLSMERGAHFATILDAFSILGYSVEWRLLNASDFGLPQNRQRVFILGSRNDAGPAGPTLLTSHDLASLRPEVRARMEGRLAWTPLAFHRDRFPTWGIAVHESFVAADPPVFSDRVEPPCLSEVLLPHVDPVFDFTESTLQRIGNSASVNALRQGVEILSNQKGGARMGYTVYGTGGLAPTLTCTASRHYERYKIGDTYRRLTNVEYARIQGFPDEHCDVVPIGRQYVLFGNAVPPPMASWVIRRALGQDPPESDIGPDVIDQSCVLQLSLV